MNSSKTLPELKHLYKALYDAVVHDRMSTKEIREAAYEFLQDVLRSCTISESSPTLQDIVDEVHKRHQMTLSEFENIVAKDERLLLDNLHAQVCLLKSAPTKLLDGVWLHRVQQSVQDPVLQKILFGIYKDEHGGDDPNLDHVKIYQDLLQKTIPHLAYIDASSIIDHSLINNVSLLIPGCIQLSLCICTDMFLPELVGYNLSYEQLPVHILQTIRDLKSLGIDPLYFSLHASVDNIHSGHARRSIDAAKRLMQVSADPSETTLRVLRGMWLADAAPGMTCIAKTWDVSADVDCILIEKALASASIHLLSNDTSLFQVMKKNPERLWNWLMKNEYLDADVFDDTRFGRLLKGPMLSVFDPLETSLLKRRFGQVVSDQSSTIDLINRKFSMTLVNHSHLKDPCTGLRLVDIFERSPQDFLKTLQTPYWKDRFIQSVTSGSMRKSFRPKEKELLLKFFGSS